MAQHLTDAVVRRLPVPAKGNKVSYDAAIAGFGVRVTANGSRSYILNYRTRSGRERRYTIGDATHWRCTAARTEAKRLKLEVDQGGDPQGDLQDERAAPTMLELTQRFEVEHLPRLRPLSRNFYPAVLKSRVLPFFGAKTKVADVTYGDVDRFHRAVTAEGSSYAANRYLSLLSKMFSLAVRWGMRDSNPCKGVEKNYEAKRRRYLSGDELVRLTTALAEHDDQQAANIIRLLSLSGARRGEMLAMRWADVDLRTGVWTKLGSTVKQQTDHIVPLSAPARQLLAEIFAAQRPLGEYVFPGRYGHGHRETINKNWRRLLKAADLANLRIHDLRHSYASHLASAGVSLHTIGALLGHASPTTTHRYAHLFDDPLRAATERVGAVIAAAGKPSKPPPLELKRGGRP
jgi:integrase